MLPRSRSPTGRTVVSFGLRAYPRLAAQALSEGGLVQVLDEWAFEARPYMGPVWLLYPPNRFLPSKVRALIDYLASHLHDAVDE